MVRWTIAPLATAMCSTDKHPPIARCERGNLSVKQMSAVSKSDQRLFGAAFLIVLGRMSLVIALAMVGTSVSFGWPNTWLRLAVGTVFGLAAIGLGTKMAGGSWVHTFNRVVHQSAAVAGLIFLVVALRRFAMTRYAPSVPLYTCILLSFASLFSWWLRAGKRSPLRNRQAKHAS